MAQFPNERIKPIRKKDPGIFLQPNLESLFDKRQALCKPKFGQKVSIVRTYRGRIL